MIIDLTAATINNVPADQVKKQLMRYERASNVAKWILYPWDSIRKKRIHYAWYVLLSENAVQSSSIDDTIKNEFVSTCLDLDKKSRWPLRWYYYWKQDSRKKRAEQLFEITRWLQRREHCFTLPSLTEDRFAFRKAVKNLWYRPIQFHLKQVYIMRIRMHSSIATKTDQSYMLLLTQGQALLNNFNKEDTVCLSKISQWLFHANAALKKENVSTDTVSMRLKSIVLQHQIHWLSQIFQTLLNTQALHSIQEEVETWKVFQKILSSETKNPETCSLIQAFLALTVLNENFNDCTHQFSQADKAAQYWIKNSIFILDELFPLLENIIPTQIALIKSRFHQLQDQYTTPLWERFALLMDMISELHSVSATQLITSGFQSLEAITREDERSTKNARISVGKVWLTITQYFIKACHSSEATEFTQQKDFFIDKSATHLTQWATHLAQTVLLNVLENQFNSAKIDEYQKYVTFVLHTGRESDALKKLQTADHQLHSVLALANSIDTLLLKAKTLMSLAFHTTTDAFEAETNDFIVEMNHWLKDYNILMRDSTTCAVLGERLTEYLQCTQRMIVSHLIERLRIWRAALFSDHLAMNAPWFSALQAADSKFSTVLKDQFCIDFSYEFQGQPLRYVIRREMNESQQFQWTLNYYQTPNSPAKNIPIDAVDGLRGTLGDPHPMCETRLRIYACSEKIKHYHFRYRYEPQKPTLCFTFADPMSAEYDDVKVMYIALLNLLNDQIQLDDYQDRLIHIPENILQLINTYNELYLRHQNIINDKTILLSRPSHDKHNNNTISLIQHYLSLCDQFPTLATAQREIDISDAWYQSQNLAWKRAAKNARLQLHPDKATDAKQGVALCDALEVIEKTFFDTSNYQNIRVTLLNTDLNNLVEQSELWQRINLADDTHFTRLSMKLHMDHFRHLEEVNEAYLKYQKTITGLFSTLMSFMRDRLRKLSSSTTTSDEKMDIEQDIIDCMIDINKDLLSFLELNLYPSDEIMTFLDSEWVTQIGLHEKIDVNEFRGHVKAHHDKSFSKASAEVAQCSASTVCKMGIFSESVISEQVGTTHNASNSSQLDSSRDLRPSIKFK